MKMNIRKERLPLQCATEASSPWTPRSRPQKRSRPRAEGDHALSFGQCDPLFLSPTPEHWHWQGEAYHPTQNQATMPVLVGRKTPHLSRPRRGAYGQQHPLMVEGGFRFEHHPCWQMSVLQSVVFCESVRGEEDGQEESSHAPEVAAAVRPDVHLE